ncbi:hypothetical protein KSW81_002553 [Nannochloris sp. 'desiccata']|nr:hypothetical protein KSW81_002553 [Chlorella desiccata (nom. nud.)]
MPEPVLDDSVTVSYLGAGSAHSLALVEISSGSIVVSWGRGEDGQLGHGDAEERLNPQAVFSLIGKNVRFVTCGAEYSVCVAKDSDDADEVYAWGWADFGRLGLGACSDVFIPTPIQAFSGKKVGAIACGDTHTLVALEGSGHLYTFGRNQNGQLGTGDTEDSMLPRHVTALAGKKVINVAAGAEHSIVCTSEGEVYAFGWNRYGNLGTNDREDRHIPTKLEGIDKVVAVGAGWRHSLAIRGEERQLFSWGWSKYGQLGHGDQSDHLVPKKVESFADYRVLVISGGWRHSAAIVDAPLPKGRHVACWGWNQFGQLGLGHNKDTYSPEQVVALAGEEVRELAAGWKHTIVTTGAKTWAWGRGANAQLGNGEAKDVNLPVLLPELTKGAALSVEALTKASHPVVAYSIPPGDRYAVVPDNGEDGAVPHADDPDLYFVFESETVERLDSCGYCTFAQGPVPGHRVFMTLEEVLTVARMGAEQGCTEALFTLGDKPELKYPEAAAELASMGYPSTIAYVAAASKAVLENTGLLPHINAGVMSREDLRLLKTVSVSQGLMLESLSTELITTPGAAHYNCPDKEPAVRLEMLESAGKERVPFTTGILIGIGETKLNRIEALLKIKESHERYGHVQEVIIQNFRAKKGTAFENNAEPSLDDFLWTIAAARLILGKEMSIQAPPNLTPESDDAVKQSEKQEKSTVYSAESSNNGSNTTFTTDSGDLSWLQLLNAGINDWGGISPLTRDYVNPERPWPHILSLARATAAAGKQLVPRLPVYPFYLSIDKSSSRSDVNVVGGTHHGSYGNRWLDGIGGAKSPLAAVLKSADAFGLARASNWYAGMIEKGSEPITAPAATSSSFLSSSPPPSEEQTENENRDAKRRAVPLPRQKKPWRIAMDTNGLLVGDPSSASMLLNDKRAFSSAHSGLIESLLSTILQNAFTSSSSTSTPFIPASSSPSSAAHNITEEDISLLFSARGNDFSAVVNVANQLRRRINGDTVTYVVNRNINYTNICTFGCKFCAFSKGPAAEELRGAPYLLDFEEVTRRTTEAWARGATEVCMQGGIHPDFTGDTYLKLIAAAKKGAPDIHVHAFSPLEVAQGASTLGWSLSRYLSSLKDAGLGSLPGTAAEILDDDVRAELCPDKLTAQEWVEVITTAHNIGLKTTSTIMFGHVDSITSWARHLLILRNIAATTGKITEFVPLPFVHMEAPMFRKGISRAGPTLRECILMHAIARLALHPYITNIQASWVKMGPNRAAQLLAAGCNDMGGVLMNESITRAAGAGHGQELGALEMERLIREAGRVPEQRSTLYGRPPAMQTAVSLQ